MYRESIKFLLIGMVLSAVSWWLISSSIDSGTFTFVYIPVIIGAFFGLMLVLYGITNSGNQSAEEFEATLPWAMTYKPQKSYFKQAQFAHQVHHARQGGLNLGDEHV